MTNKEIYKKTLTFSIRALLLDLLMLVIIAGLSVLGFVILDKADNMGLAGLGIGLVIGIIIAAIIGHFFSYALKAGQIAMMTRAISEGELPDNVYQEGKKAVKERFLTVAAFYAVTNVIKGIFNEIGRAITGVGNAIGGDTGGAIGSGIAAIIQTIVSYLCDCCLGWVFYRKDKGSVRATLEGAALFFKHGKTFVKNMGRVFGMGLVSMLLIGGVFFGIFFAIFANLPTTFVKLSAEIMETGARHSMNLPEFLGNPTILAAVVAGIIALIIWGFIHSTFIRPFVLTGVLRNYLESGMQDIPTESEFATLEQKSRKFANLRKKLDQEG